MTISEIKAAAEAATQGPWTTNWAANEVVCPQKEVSIAHIYHASLPSSEGHSNGEFIALSRTAVPALCRALEVAKTELRKIHEEMAGRDCIESHEAWAKVEQELESIK